MIKSWEKFEVENKMGQFLIKKKLLNFPGLHKGRPNYRRGLQLSKKNIQHFKI
jgi:hypothetical protein